MRLFSTLTLLLLMTDLRAQPACDGAGRYADSVFACVDVTPNIQYGTGLRDWSWNHLFCLNLQPPPYNTRLPLLFDFYAPCDDTVAQRPLVIVVHGGAWAAGNKADLAEFSQFLAKRGYAVASVGYRLSLPSNPLCWDQDADSVKLIRAAARAIQDARAAVRFFRANAAEYRIDPDYIFIGGASAGGFTALGVGYVDEDERPGACGPQPQYGNWFGHLNLPDMGSVEGDGGNPGFSSKVRGVINMSGALFKLDFMDGPQDPPLISFHGMADNVVPFGYGCALQNAIDLNIYHKCIKVYGAGAFQSYADSIGLESKLVAFPNGGHGYTAAEVIQLSENTVDFLCENLAKPVPVSEPGFAQVPVRIFPNPAGAMIQLQTPDPQGLWRLYDATGRLVRSVAPQRSLTHIDRGDLPAGFYVWHWQGRQNALSGTIVLN